MDLSIHTAALQGNTVQLLARVNEGVNIDEKDETGNTALMISVENNELSCFDLLLERKASPNAVNRGQPSALVIAARMGRRAMCWSLIKAGADLHAKSTYGNTASQIALEKGFKSIAALLHNKLPQDSADWPVRVFLLIANFDC